EGFREKKSASTVDFPISMPSSPEAPPATVNNRFNCVSSPLLFTISKVNLLMGFSLLSPGHTLGRTHPACEVLTARNLAMNRLFRPGVRASDGNGMHGQNQFRRILGDADAALLAQIVVTKGVGFPGY